MTVHQSIASRRQRFAQPIRPDVVPTGSTRARSTIMNVATGLQLLNEALARVRMQRPQDLGTSEAYRPARRTAMNARSRESRILGE
jgi:hypothetical protein